MSTEVIGVFDRGFATIKDNKGRPMKVNVFVFRTVTNEAAPDDVLAFCNPIYKDTIIKNLRRLMWVKTPSFEFDTSQHREKIDRDEYIEALEISAHDDEFINP